MLVVGESVREVVTSVFVEESNLPTIDPSTSPEFEIVPVQLQQIKKASIAV